MELSRTIETETGEMIVKRVSVPLGLEELMEGLAKEVILKKPKDMYVFASEYFTRLLALRDSGVYRGNVKSSKLAVKLSSKTTIMGEKTSPSSQLDNSIDRNFERKPRTPYYLNSSGRGSSKTDINRKAKIQEYLRKKRETYSEKVLTDQTLSSEKEELKTFKRVRGAKSFEHSNIQSEDQHRKSRSKEGSNGKEIYLVGQKTGVEKNKTSNEKENSNVEKLTRSKKHLRSTRSVDFEKTATVSPRKRKSSSSSHTSNTKESPKGSNERFGVPFKTGQSKVEVKGICGTDKLNEKHKSTDKSQDCVELVHEIKEKPPMRKTSQLSQGNIASIQNENGKYEIIYSPTPLHSNEEEMTDHEISEESLSPSRNQGEVTKTSIINDPEVIPSNENNQEQKILCGESSSQNAENSKDCSENTNNELDPKQDELKSAVHIQKMWRGYDTRKKMKQQIGISRTIIKSDENEIPTIDSSPTKLSANHESRKDEIPHKQKISEKTEVEVSTPNEGKNEKFIDSCVENSEKNMDEQEKQNKVEFIENERRDKESVMCGNENLEHKQKTQVREKDEEPDDNKKEEMMHDPKGNDEVDSTEKNKKKTRSVVGNGIISCQDENIENEGGSQVLGNAEELVGSTENSAVLSSEPNDIVTKSTKRSEKSDGDEDTNSSKTCENSDHHEYITQTNTFSTNGTSSPGDEVSTADKKERNAEIQDSFANHIKGMEVESMTSTNKVLIKTDEEDRCEKGVSEKELSETETNESSFSHNEAGIGEERIVKHDCISMTNFVEEKKTIDESLNENGNANLSSDTPNVDKSNENRDCQTSDENETSNNQAIDSRKIVEKESSQLRDKKEQNYEDAVDSESDNLENKIDSAENKNTSTRSESKIEGNVHSKSKQSFDEENENIPKGAEDNFEKSSPDMNVYCEEAVESLSHENLKSSIPTKEDEQSHDKTGRQPINMNNENITKKIEQNAEKSEGIIRTRELSHDFSDKQEVSAQTPRKPERTVNRLEVESTKDNDENQKDDQSLVQTNGKPNSRTEVSRVTQEQDNEQPTSCDLSHVAMPSNRVSNHISEIEHDILDSSNPITVNSIEQKSSKEQLSDEKGHETTPISSDSEKNRASHVDSNNYSPQGSSQQSDKPEAEEHESSPYESETDRENTEHASIRKNSNSNKRNSINNLQNKEDDIVDSMNFDNGKFKPSQKSGQKDNSKTNSESEDQNKLSVPFVESDNLNESERKIDDRTRLKRSLEISKEETVPENSNEIFLHDNLLLEEIDRTEPENYTANFKETYDSKLESTQTSDESVNNSVSTITEDKQRPKNSQMDKSDNIIGGPEQTADSATKNRILIQKKTMIEHSDAEYQVQDSSNLMKPKHEEPKTDDINESKMNPVELDTINHNLTNIITDTDSLLKSTHSERQEYSHDAKPENSNDLNRMTIEREEENSKSQELANIAMLHEKASKGQMANNIICHTESELPDKQKSNTLSNLENSTTTDSEHNDKNVLQILETAKIPMDVSLASIRRESVPDISTTDNPQLNVESGQTRSITVVKAVQKPLETEKLKQDSSEIKRRKSPIKAQKQQSIGQYSKHVSVKNPSSDSVNTVNHQKSKLEKSKSQQQKVVRPENSTNNIKRAQSLESKNNSNQKRERRRASVSPEKRISNKASEKSPTSSVEEKLTSNVERKENLEELKSVHSGNFANKVELLAPIVIGTGAVIAKQSQNGDADTANVEEVALNQNRSKAVEGVQRSQEASGDGKEDKTSVNKNSTTEENIKEEQRTDRQVNEKFQENNYGEHRRLLSTSEIIENDKSIEKSSGETESTFNEYNIAEIPQNDLTTAFEDNQNHSGIHSNESKDESETSETKNFNILNTKMNEDQDCMNNDHSIDATNESNTGSSSIRNTNLSEATTKIPSECDTKNDFPSKFSSENPIDYGISNDNLNGNTNESSIDSERSQDIISSDVLIKDPDGPDTEDNPNICTDTSLLTPCDTESNKALSVENSLESATQNISTKTSKMVAQNSAMSEIEEISENERENEHDISKSKTIGEASATEVKRGSNSIDENQILTKAENEYEVSGISKNEIEKTIEPSKTLGNSAKDRKLDQPSVENENSEITEMNGSNLEELEHSSDVIQNVREITNECDNSTSSTPEKKMNRPPVNEENVIDTTENKELLEIESPTNKETTKLTSEREGSNAKEESKNLKSVQENEAVVNRPTNSSTSHQDETHEGYASLIQSTIKIQTIWRGYQARKNMLSILHQRKEHVQLSKKNIIDENKNIVNVEEHNMEPVHNKKSLEEQEEYKRLKMGTSHSVEVPENGNETEKQTTNKIDNKVHPVNKKQFSADDIAAAVKIQSSFRGFKTRRRSKYPLNGPMPKPDLSTNIGKDYVNQALKIQSAWRAYKVRKNIRDVEEKINEIEHLSGYEIPKSIHLTDGEILKAVTKIQAGLRGYMARKHFKNLLELNKSLDGIQEEPNNIHQKSIQSLGLGDSETQKPIDEIDKNSGQSKIVSRTMNGDESLINSETLPKNEDSNPLQKSRNVQIETDISPEEKDSLSTPVTSVTNSTMNPLSFCEDAEEKMKDNEDKSQEIVKVRTKNGSSDNEINKARDTTSETEQDKTLVGLSSSMNAVPDKASVQVGLKKSRASDNLLELAAQFENDDKDPKPTSEDVSDPMMESAESEVPYISNGNIENVLLSKPNNSSDETDSGKSLQKTGNNTVSFLCGPESINVVSKSEEKFDNEISETNNTQNSMVSDVTTKPVQQTENSKLIHIQREPIENLKKTDNANQIHLSAKIPQLTNDSKSVEKNENNACPKTPVAGTRITSKHSERNTELTLENSKDLHELNGNREHEKEESFSVKHASSEKGNTSKEKEAGKDIFLDNITDMKKSEENTRETESSSQKHVGPTLNDFMRKTLDIDRTLPEDENIKFVPEINETENTEASSRYTSEPEIKITEKSRYEAATKIQSTYRGFRCRKNTAFSKENNSLDSKQTTNKFDVKDQEVQHAHVEHSSTKNEQLNSITTTSSLNEQIIGKKDSISSETGELRASEDGMPASHNSNSTNTDGLSQANVPAGVEVLTTEAQHHTHVGDASVDVEAEAQLPTQDASSAQKVLNNKSRVESDRGMESTPRNNSTLRNKNMEAEAATKIQAGFRGYQVRKQLKVNKSDGDTAKRTVRRKSSGRLTEVQSKKQKENIELKEKSAVKIQAGIRGFLVRRKVRNPKTSE